MTFVNEDIFVSQVEAMAVLVVAAATQSAARLVKWYSV